MEVGTKTRVLKPLLFAAPGLLIFFVLWMVPMIVTAVMSFFDASGFTQAWVFVGLDNYRDIFNDMVFYTSLLNNLHWMWLSIVFPIIIGLLFALHCPVAILIYALVRSLLTASSVATSLNDHPLSGLPR